MFKYSSKLVVLFSILLVLVSGVLFVSYAEEEDYTLTFEAEKQDLNSDSEVDESDIWGGEAADSIDESVDHSEDKDKLELDNDQLVADATVVRAFRGSFFSVYGPCGARVSRMNPGTTYPTFKVFHHGPRCEYRFYTYARPAYFFQVLYFDWPGVRSFVRANIF